MAIKLFSLLILLLFTTIATVSARPGIPFHPCNTLIISTYSFSLRQPQPQSHLHLHNPNFPNLPNFPQFRNPNPDFIFMDLHPVLRHRLRHRHRYFLLPTDLRTTTPKTAITNTQRSSEMTDLPLGFSSLRERTRDILSVVASLLFGAACGALTAGTMYLIWSILNFRHGDYRNVDGFSDDDDDNDDNDDLFNPKKSHYVAIPAAAAAPVNEKDADAKANANATV
ncbi:uncharacterized protein LOC141646511 [Silene latifolia]|uniref:uncharacterized protein LOC141646511 n=1 Tax=Silene latifolia TaxID=37657 RepID=UPI003D7822A9